MARHSLQIATYVGGPLAGMALLQMTVQHTINKYTPVVQVSATAPTMKHSWMLTRLFTTSAGTTPGYIKCEPVKNSSTTPGYIKCEPVKNSSKGPTYIHACHIHNKDGTINPQRHCPPVRLHPLTGVVYDSCIRVLTPKEYADASSISVVTSASPQAHFSVPKSPAYLMHWLTARTYTIDLSDNANCK